MKGGFSIESDITAGYFSSGISTMFNNYISSVDTINTIKTASSVLPKDQMLSLCQKQGTIVTTSQVQPFDNNFTTNSAVVNGSWGAIPAGTNNWTLGWTKF